MFPRSSASRNATTTSLARLAAREPRQQVQEDGGPRAAVIGPGDGVLAAGRIAVPVRADPRVVVGSQEESAGPSPAPAAEHADDVPAPQQRAAELHGELLHGHRGPVVAEPLLQQAGKRVVRCRPGHTRAQRHLLFDEPHDFQRRWPSQEMSWTMRSSRTLRDTRRAAGSENASNAASSR